MVGTCPQCGHRPRRNIWHNLGYIAGWMLLEVLEHAF